MRKGAQELKDLDVDRAAPPAVKRSSSDETVDPSGSNVDGEHDAADGVEGRRPRSRPPRRRGLTSAAGKARVSFNALTHGISSTRLVDGDAIKAASPHLMDKVHALQDSCGADIGEPGKPMPKAAKTYSGDSSSKAWQPSVAALAGHRGR